MPLLLAIAEKRALSDRKPAATHLAALLGPIESAATLARKVLGWSPQVPFETTLRDVLDDYRARVRNG